ncbi:MAG: 4-alpha-glucanotransferase [Verrucomicrobium sp.]|nr:4-alpha-glucanotransferase [Verrucomicrobium sp.]
MPSLSEKAAGILVPAFALREVGDLGIGDSVSMRAAIDFCAVQKFRWLQILPINETGGDNSPYNAISSVALEPALLRMTPDEVPGLLEEHLQALAHLEVRQELDGPAVDYPRVKRLKLELLRLAFAHFQAAGEEPLRREWEKFRQESAWLPAYTLFRTLLDHHHGDERWPLWNPSVRRPDEAEKWLAARPDAEKKELERSRAFYGFVQWVAYRQWDRTKRHATAQGVSLMGDIPFGVSRYSADVWAQQELFDMSWSGGAPPERFFQGDPFTTRWGQNWGIPIYPWELHRTQNFAWWRRRVGATCQVFHSFRIDHVLGFFRVYSFPWTPERNAEFVNLSEEEAARHADGRLPRFIPRADEPAASAELNAAEGKALLQMIQDAAHGAPVVAEDLGMVPDYVRPLLQELGIPGFTIPIFERQDSDRSYKRFEAYPKINLITYSTHDHEPVATFYEKLVQHWTGPDGDAGWREVQHFMDYLGWRHEDAPRHFTDSLHHRLLEVLFQSPCWLAVLMITDLLGTKQRFNEPGSVGAANWSQRLDRPLKSFLEDPTYAQRIRSATELIGQTSRA